MGKEAETAEEYNSVIFDALHSDFRPCYAADKKTFESCLKAINGMDPQIPTGVTIDGVNYTITIPEIEAPVEEPLPTSIIQRITDFLNSIFAALAGLFG